MTRYPTPLVRIAMVLSLLLFAAACAGGDDADPPDEAAGSSDGPTTEGPSDAGSPTEADATEADATGEAGALTVYSGRSEELVGPLIEAFRADTGVEVEVRYGDTAELAATILDEGDNSPADVFFAQDAGALGALQAEGVLTELPQETLDLVEERFRSTEGNWVGASGRARVLVYSTELVEEADLPESILDLTDEEWAGRVGWAPTNASFQAQVTAMRVLLGEEETAAWLEGMIANDVQVFDGNAPQVEAAGAGEIAIGLVNNYYLPRTLAENPDLAAANHFLPGTDVGSLVNIAGAGILGTSDQTDVAEQFVAYLLTEASQTYFAEETYEYPLIDGIDPIGDQPSLDEVVSPDVDLSALADLQGTLDLLVEVGAI